ncbi:hypothetical protein VW35_00845 [Devosia soli]|uniref:Uncharacterized protein n=1 Tax=Devosia soli TaxID=361041 RepID=A0A0F5LEK3_9HYPH|nr:heparin lyase I family protein [Devosia soli]KKB80788.1 hypothetical protein VW35_00845 [Devosia soli]
MSQLGLGSIRQLGTLKLGALAPTKGGGWEPVKGLGTDLVGYFDARRPETITTSSGAVSSFRDVIAGYDMAQATAASRPTFKAGGFDGLDCLYFDGVDDCLLLSSVPFPSGSAPSEVWAVVQQDKPTTDAVNGTLMMYGNASSTSRRLARAQLSGLNRYQSLAGNGTTGLTNYQTDTKFNDCHVVRSIFDGANMYSEIEGIASTPSAAVPATATTRSRIGASSASTPTEFWRGKILCILVTKPLSGGKAAQLRRYLENLRWRQYERHYVRGNDYSFQNLNNRSEQRFEVRSGDQPLSADVTNGNERSELSIPASMSPIAVDGSLVQLRWSFLVEAGAPLTSAFAILGQIHQTEDAGESHQRPWLAVNMRPDERLELNIIADPNAISDGTAPINVAWTSPSPITRGVYHDVAIDLRHGPSAGYLKFVLDGDVKYDQATAIGNNDQNPSYFKYGIYRKAAAETLAVRYRTPEITVPDSYANTFTFNGSPYTFGDTAYEYRA